MVVDEVGLWLERILHISNSCRGTLKSESLSIMLFVSTLTKSNHLCTPSGDSPKVAGCMDLFRVQGRWGPSARLAWVRCVLKTTTDVCGGSQLSKVAQNTFPAPEYFELWADYIDGVFVQHVNNIIRVEMHHATGTKNASSSKKSEKNQNTSLYQYRIDRGGEEQLLRTLLTALGGADLLASLTDNRVNSFKKTDNSAFDERRSLRQRLNISEWSDPILLSFLHTTLRGFFRADLYTAMTEFLSRAEGSFGLQV
jgi:hypothetical protein